MDDLDYKIYTTEELSELTQGLAKDERARVLNAWLEQVTQGHHGRGLAPLFPRLPTWWVELVGTPNRRGWGFHRTLNFYRRLLEFTKDEGADEPAVEGVAATTGAAPPAPALVSMRWWHPRFEVLRFHRSWLFRELGASDIHCYVEADLDGFKVYAAREHLGTVSTTRAASELLEALGWLPGNVYDELPPRAFGLLPDPEGLHRRLNGYPPPLAGVDWAEEESQTVQLAIHPHTTESSRVSGSDEDDEEIALALLTTEEPVAEKEEAPMEVTGGAVGEWFHSPQTVKALLRRLGEKTLLDAYHACFRSRSTRSQVVEFLTPYLSPEELMGAQSASVAFCQQQLQKAISSKVTPG